MYDAASRQATCVDVAGANYPTEFNGRRIHPLEGQSLRAFLSPAPDLPVSLSDRPLFWEVEGNAAIRVGDLRLVLQGGRGEWS